MLTRTKWDWRTSIEEVMNGLHYLVASGKVRYLVSLFAKWTPPTSPNPPLASQLHQGISDTPAWIVTKANMYARMTGKTPFCIYQGGWSILRWDFERDIIPMAREEGVSLLMYSYTCVCPLILRATPS